jgi:hypothetical protein
MTIENYPVWSFEPEWSSSVSEMLEWLTDIMASPNGSEQRRTLRYFPRRSLEFSILTEADERQLLDNMLVSFGGTRWYLPLWHEANLLDTTAASGSSTVVSDDARNGSGIKVGSIVYFAGNDAYTYELAEVATLTANGFTTVSPLLRTWPAGTRVMPVCSAELTDQPQLTPRTSNLVSAEIRFRVMDTWGDTTDDEASEFDSVYRDFFVMAMEPDTRERSNIDYERKFVEIDNQTSVPYRVDEAGRAFTLREFIWTLEGREEHAAFARMLQIMRGRAIPVWVPTFMDDFTPRLTITAGTDFIEVGRCGFTAAGGPRWDRQDIMIETVGGARIYRRIVSSTEGINGERLVVDRAFEDTYTLADILRISAITLMRLNHDSITIDHEVDNVGVSTVKATFRSAPNTRIPESAFNE